MSDCPPFPQPPTPTQANADPSVISSMHKLSQRIAVALQHEERRCQYLTREAKLMLAVQDEITNITESEASFTALTSSQHRCPTRGPRAESGSFKCGRRDLQLQPALWA